MPATDSSLSNSSQPQQKKRTVFFVVALFTLSVFGVLAYEVYSPHAVFLGAKKIVITPGMGSRAIGMLLKQEGVIASKWAFVFYVAVRGEASRLLPGRYEFFDTAAIPDIARDLIAGAVREREITIPEGWNNREIIAYLSAEGFRFEMPATDFVLYSPENMIRQFSFLSELPRGEGFDLEGYLFPDTYRVFQDTSREKIMMKMLKNFDEKITADLREEIARQKKTLFEIITMASLIEKEVISDEDRAIVSGVLWKRLDAGIPLQVDATLVYAKSQHGNSVSMLGDTTAKNGKISRADIKIDSPYNTYKYRGFPPGPIANPGLSAVRAAIYPKQSPHLYYLSAPDGRTIFSRTLDEHNAAKAKYLR